MTLLQIAGGQTWPNFLPILAWRPSRVIFLTSSDLNGSFSKSIEHLYEAAAIVGVAVEMRQISTKSAIPDFVECELCLRQLEKEPIDVINLTGGTKTMAIAAFCFATERKIPSFHLDTRRKEAPFDDFHSAPFLAPFPDLEPISRQISVRTALKAQGFPVPPSFKTPSEEFISFAKEAGELRDDENQAREISTALLALRANLTDERGNLLKKGKLRAALQNPICPAPNSSWNAYLKAAADHGIGVELDPPGQFLLVSQDPAIAVSDELSSEAEQNFKLLEGVWFELLVLDHLRTKSSFSDVCWSVEADHTIDNRASSKGETDLIAFNHKTLNLHFISCKTTGPHSSPLDHIQGLKRRATKEGGQYAKAELWIFRTKDEQHRKMLANHCKEQEVELRVFVEQTPS